MKTTATVTVSVNRNLNPPRMNPPSVDIFVDQDVKVPSWGYPVNVTDPDSVSNKFNGYNF